MRCVMNREKRRIWLAQFYKYGIMGIEVISKERL